MTASAFFKTPAPSQATRPEPSYDYSSNALTREQGAAAADHAAAWSASRLGGAAASTLVRNWRFPSSRKYLWDRTASGQTVSLNPEDYLPVVEVGPGTLVAAAEAVARRSSMHADPGSGLQLNLVATFAAGTGGQPRAQLRLRPADGNAGDDRNLLVTCQVHGAADRAAPQQASGSSTPLKGSFRAVLDRRGPAQARMLCSVCCSVQLHGDGSAVLHGALLVPGAPLALLPLFSKRLCDVPLTSALSNPIPQGEVQNGLLTLDQARSLLPLAAEDPNVYIVPLVGVWIKGVRSLHSPEVLACCLRFCCSSTLSDRATQDGAFLLLLFPSEGSSVPACYEVRFLDPQQLPSSAPAPPPLAALPLTFYRFTAHLLPGASSPVSALPLLDPHAPRPLLHLLPSHRTPSSPPPPPAAPGSPISPSARAVAKARAAAAALSTQQQHLGAWAQDDTAAVRDNRLFTSPSKALKLSNRAEWMPPTAARSSHAPAPPAAPGPGPGYGWLGGGGGYVPGDTTSSPPPEPRSSAAPTPFRAGAPGGGRPAAPAPGSAFHPQDEVLRILEGVPSTASAPGAWGGPAARRPSHITNAHPPGAEPPVPEPGRDSLSDWLRNPGPSSSSSSYQLHVDPGYPQQHHGTPSSSCLPPGQWGQQQQQQQQQRYSYAGWGGGAEREAGAAAAGGWVRSSVGGLQPLYNPLAGPGQGAGPGAGAGRAHVPAVPPTQWEPPPRAPAAAGNTPGGPPPQPQATHGGQLAQPPAHSHAGGSVWDYGGRQATPYARPLHQDAGAGWPVMHFVEGAGGQGQGQGPEMAVALATPRSAAEQGEVEALKAQVSSLQAQLQSLMHMMAHVMPAAAAAGQLPLLPAAAAAAAAGGEPAGAMRGPGPGALSSAAGTAARSRVQDGSCAGPAAAATPAGLTQQHAPEQQQSAASRASPAASVASSSSSGAWRPGSTSWPPPTAAAAASVPRVPGDGCCDTPAAAGPASSLVLEELAAGYDEVETTRTDFLFTPPTSEPQSLRSSGDHSAAAADFGGQQGQQVEEQEVAGMLEVQPEGAGWQGAGRGSDIIARAAEILQRALQARGAAAAGKAALASPRSLVDSGRRGGLEPRQLWSSAAASASSPASGSGAVRTPSAAHSRRRAGAGRGQGMTPQRRAVLGLSDDEEDEDGEMRGDGDELDSLDGDGGAGDEGEEGDGDGLHARLRRTACMRMSLDSAPAPLPPPYGGLGGGPQLWTGEPRGSEAAGAAAAAAGGRPPVRCSSDIVRTRCIELEDEGSGSSDSDMDEELMRKYGIHA